MGLVGGLSGQGVFMQDRVVTIFGGTGFIGRYVAQALLARGARLRVVGRDPRQGWQLKAMAGLGQIQFVGADVRRPDTVARALDGASDAVNLVGVMGRDAMAINGRGAGNVAQAAAAAGVGRLVHVSAIGTDGDATYAQSKRAGEAAVREAFPDATILRPSIVFGPEDAFINRFAGMARMMPVVPVMAPTTRFQPVFAGDLAEAVARVLEGQARGETLDIGGPEVLTMEALNRWIGVAAGRRRPLLPVPNFAARMIARAGDWLPGAPIDSDQWRMLQHDSVVTGEDGLARLGIQPTALADVADGWLTRYRRQGRFAVTTA